MGPFTSRPPDIAAPEHDYVRVSRKKRGKDLHESMIMGRVRESKTGGRLLVQTETQRGNKNVTPTHLSSLSSLSSLASFSGLHSSGAVGGIEG